jgi:hypothetical protein
MEPLKITSIWVGGVFGILPMLVVDYNFNYNIAGIGRDVASDLYQIKSSNLVSNYRVRRDSSDE